MRIVLITIGGRGDTEPFVALAVRLMREGHSVRRAARPDFAGLAAYSVEFASLGRPYQPFISWLIQAYRSPISASGLHTAVPWRVVADRSGPEDSVPSHASLIES